jgi:WD40 repeat protein
LSPDGKRVATGGYDGMVRLWDAETGQLVRVLVGHDSYVYGLAWSADGQYLASSGSYDATVRIWEAQTGLPLKVLKGVEGPPVGVAWSPDGSLVAAGTVASGYIAIWNAVTGELEKSLGNGKPVTCLAFSPDSRTLAYGISETGIGLLTAPGWKSLDKVPLVDQDARTVSFLADGKQLLVAGTKHTLIWDLAGKKVVRQLEGIAGAVARQGNQLAVAAPTNKVVDLETGKAGVSLPYSYVLDWSADGKAIYLLSGDDVVRVDPSKGSEVKRWSVAETGTVWWWQGRPIVTHLNTTQPRVWDNTTGKLLFALEGHTAPASTLAWSPGGKILATGGADKTVRVWNPSTGKSVRTLTGFEAAVTALAIAGDGKVAAGSADGRIRVFAEEKLLKTWIGGHKEAVRALAWGPDGRLVSGGVEAGVPVWGLASDKPANRLENAGSVECLAFSPNGKWLAVGASENRINVWTWPGRKLVHEFSALGSPPAVSAVAWSPDSSQLLGGRANHTLQLWDPKLEKEKHNFIVMAPVQSVAWSAGGRIMVTCTLDRSVRFWSAQNGRIQSTLFLDKGQLSWVATEGHYRVANEAETELVAVVFTGRGMDTLSLKEFATRYGWKNNPARARTSGN